jgi:ribosome-binding protein aMBF1 (putative translation factor)
MEGFMQILGCTGCGKYEEKSDDLVSWTCGSCSCRNVARVQHELEEELKHYTRKQSRAARKKRGWSQKILAFTLDIPTHQISGFERKNNPNLIHPRHADWLDKQK